MKEEISVALIFSTAIAFLLLAKDFLIQDLLIEAFASFGMGAGLIGIAIYIIQWSITQKINKTEEVAT